jgi:hypothetical protein
MKSFLEGRQVVSRNEEPAERAGSSMPSFGQAPGEAIVPKPASAAVADHRAPKSAPHGEKKIETVEVDGVVQKIIVTCSCGETIEVHCGY